MSSAICLNLDLYKILSSGNGLYKNGCISSDDLLGRVHQTLLSLESHSHNSGKTDIMNFSMMVLYNCFACKKKRRQTYSINQLDFF